MAFMPDAREKGKNGQQEADATQPDDCGLALQSLPARLTYHTSVYEGTMAGSTENDSETGKIDCRPNPGTWTFLFAVSPILDANVLASFSKMVVKCCGECAASR